MNVNAGKVLLAKFFPDSGEYVEGMEALREMIGDYVYTPKEAAFIIYYIEDFNGTSAAIKAGYSTKTAGVIAHELLHKDKIRYRIALELSELYSRSVLSVLERKEILTRISRGDITDFTEVSNGNLVIKSDSLEQGKAKGAIKRIKMEKTSNQFGETERVELELHDPKDAIDKINRMEKVYEDRLNIGITLVELDREDKEL